MHPRGRSQPPVHPRNEADRPAADVNRPHLQLSIARPRVGPHVGIGYHGGDVRQAIGRLAMANLGGQEGAGRGRNVADALAGGGRDRPVEVVRVPSVSNSPPPLADAPPAGSAVPDNEIDDEYETPQRNRNGNGGEALPAVPGEMQRSPGTPPGVGVRVANSIRPQLAPLPPTPPYGRMAPRANRRRVWGMIEDTAADRGLMHNRNNGIVWRPPSPPAYERAVRIDPEIKAYLDALPDEAIEPQYRDYIDPITLNFPSRPVITPHGTVYDLSPLLKELDRRQRSPLTRLPLFPHQLVPGPRFIRDQLEKYGRRLKEEREGRVAGEGAGAGVGADGDGEGGGGGQGEDEDQGVGVSVEVQVTPGLQRNININNTDGSHAGVPDRLVEELRCASALVAALTRWAQSRLTRHKNKELCDLLTRGGPDGPEASLLKWLLDTVGTDDDPAAEGESAAARLKKRDMDKVKAAIKTLLQAVGPPSTSSGAAARSGNLQ
ncbi:unnamed protein product [Vitrella brassicaformis CCMP3155]|uniref:U-box domain-containing protein n=3 Tax=Vitrella brassicaformis TaxID=1169539 RepID=A0A0G4FUA2_VITBC|nr:unnamed protein product [Vitrella brassicaformis CCMP3155]|eukprot:CEM18282.1 unnamed protein product [Vitrella brassicaformis CCMP3155]